MCFRGQIVDGKPCGIPELMKVLCQPIGEFTWIRLSGEFNHPSLPVKADDSKWIGQGEEMLVRRWNHPELFNSFAIGRLSQPRISKIGTSARNTPDARGPALPEQHESLGCGSYTKENASSSIHGEKIVGSTFPHLRTPRKAMNPTPMPRAARTPNRTLGLAPFSQLAQGVSKAN